MNKSAEAYEEATLPTASAIARLARLLTKICFV